MSLKENINNVKDELNTEEKFLESFVKVERFYKKYKLLIIALLIIVIGGTIAFYITKSIQNKNKIEANIAFNEVLKNPKDETALSTLKQKNEKLFQIATYMQALKENKIVEVDIKYLKELAQYQDALEKNDINKLNSVSMQNDFLLKEFAIFNKALILTNTGKYEDAKATLKLIPEDSKVNELVKILKHYLITK